MSFMLGGGRVWKPILQRGGRKRLSRAHPLIKGGYVRTPAVDPDVTFSDSMTHHTDIVPGPRVVRLADLDVLHTRLLQAEEAGTPEPDSVLAGPLTPDTRQPRIELPLLPRRLVLRYSVKFGGRPAELTSVWWRAFVRTTFSLGLLRGMGGQAWPGILVERTRTADHALEFHPVGLAVSWAAVWPALILMALSAALVLRPGPVPLMALAAALVLLAPGPAAMRWRHGASAWHWGGRALGSDLSVAQAWWAWFPFLLPLSTGLCLSGLAIESARLDSPWWPSLAMAASGLAVVSLLVWPWAWWRSMRAKLTSLTLGPSRLQWLAPLSQAWQLGLRSLVMASLLATLTGGMMLTLWALWGLQWGHGPVQAWAVAGGVLFALVCWVVLVPYVKVQQARLIWRHVGSAHVRTKWHGSVRRQVIDAMVARLWVLVTLGWAGPDMAMRTWGCQCRSLTVHTRVDPEVLRHHWV